MTRSLYRYARRRPGNFCLNLAALLFGSFGIVCVYLLLEGFGI